jgi:hypothetical protein
MSLESGSLTLRRFFIQNRVKASSDPSWVEKLKQNAFQGKKLDLEDENMGWAVFGEELATDFKIDNTTSGKFVLFSFRRDQLKLPKGLVNLHVKSRIKERLKNEEMDTLPQKQRQEIKEEVMQEFVTQTPPSVQVIQVLIDTARSELYLTTTSDKVVDLFSQLFNQTFKLKLQEANFMATANQLLEEETFQKVLDKPGITIGHPFEINPEFEDTLEGKLGAAFLTWLLFTLETGDSTWQSEHQGEFGLTLNEYLLLEGEALGSKQMLLKKGVLTKCAELATSLRIGKLVSKIKLELARDGGTEEKNETELWGFMIDKLNYDFASLKVPKVNEGSDAARLLGRLNYVIDAVELMDELYSHFLNLRYSRKWKPVLTEMQAWVEKLQSGEAG